MLWLLQAGERLATPEWTAVRLVGGHLQFAGEPFRRLRRWTLAPQLDLVAGRTGGELVGRI